MRRYAFLGLIILLAILLFGSFVVLQRNNASPQPITLAVVGPMSGDSEFRGREMHEGIDLCLTQINANGGMNGRPVVTAYYDDQNNPDLAIEKAQEIVADGEAVAVLGHFLSSTSIAASPSYQDAEIPVITASATADAVTADNSWYFSVVFNNTYQAGFLSSYAKQVLGLQNSVIIYSDDVYGRSIAEAYSLSLQGLGGNIPYVYKIEGDTADDNRLGEIVDALTLHQNEFDHILVSTQLEQAVPIIRALRRRGFNQRILGPDSLSNDNYLRELFNELPEEQVDPGYLSDNIFAVSHIIFDVAGVEGQNFRREYFREYGINPSWTAATYCDAAKVAIHAMTQGNIRGEANTLTQDRAQIRTALQGMDRLEKSYPGVTGSIYFDQSGSAAKLATIGEYQKQAFISAPYQLQPIANPNELDNFAELQENGTVFIVNESYVYKTTVVYVGASILDINSIDIMEQSFKASFFLWFRYPITSFDPTNIRFINSIEAYDLDEPFETVVTDESVYRLYRVETVFRHEFDLRDFPFDEQALPIAFRHEDAEREQLTYVVDQLGMPRANAIELAQIVEASGALTTAGSWDATSLDLFPNLIQTDSALGNPITLEQNGGLAFSRFNIVLTLSRNSYDFLVKSLLPLMITIFLGYISLFLPLAHDARLGIGSSTLLTTAFFHLNFTNSLPEIPYTVALEYIFYVAYFLSTLLILLEIVTLKIDDLIQNSNTNTEHERIQRLKSSSTFLNRFILIAYPSVIALLVYAGFVQGYLILPDVTATSQGEIVEVQVADTTEDEGVTLRLGTWQTFQDANNKRIYAQYQPNIENFSLQVESYLEYALALPIQVESDSAPDILMLQPGTPNSWGIEDELIPLDGEIENLDALFTEDARRSYENDEGELIALPFMAVSVGVYYNKDIFAEIGAEKPQTWEEFIQAAELAQQAGYAPVANLITDGFLHVTLFNPIAASTLGGVEGREALLSGETCFNNELMARSFEQYLEFTQYLAPAVDEGVTYDAAAEFANGRAAMYIGGSWEITYFEGQVTAFDWGGFQVPALEGNAAYRILQPDTAMAIVASTQHREAALDFLRWLTEDEVLAAYNEELPGFFALRQGAVLPSNPYAREFINAEDDIDSIGLWFMPSGVPSGHDLAGGALAPLTNGEITPQEAADRIQAGLRTWYRPAQACEGLGDLIE